MKYTKTYLLLLLLGISISAMPSGLFAYCNSTNSTTDTLSGADLTTKNVTWDSASRYYCRDGSNQLIETTYQHSKASGGDMLVLASTSGSDYTHEIYATLNATERTMEGSGTINYSTQNISFSFSFPKTTSSTTSGDLYFEPSTMPFTITIDGASYTGSFDLTQSTAASDLLSGGEVIGHLKIETSTDSPPVFKPYKYENGVLVAL